MGSEDVGLGASVLRLGSQRLDALALAENLGKSREFATNRTGFTTLARVQSPEESLDIGVSAAKQLMKDNNVDLALPGVITVVTQNPPGSTIPHISAAIHARLQLPKNWTAFDIGLGCSGFVHAIGVVKGFMAEHAFLNGVIVTLDHYSPILNPNDINTQLIFGDGAAATLLTAVRPQWRVGAMDFLMDTSRGAALNRNENDFLNMNGRAVFDFSAKAVPESIQRVIEAEQLERSDIDDYVLHQGSRFIVETLGSRLGDTRKVRFVAADYGNLVSSSIPAFLAEHSSSLGPRVVASGFGVGLSVASLYLERIASDQG